MYYRLLKEGMKIEMKDTIDILLATYNGEKYVKEQIESILNQTYTNFKLIIADDGSTDQTRKILKEYEKKDDRIELHLQENNQGYIKNFEFLLKQVKHDIYMLSDQDDIWLPKKVEKTYEQLKKQEADLVFGDLEVVNEKLETLFSSFNDYMKLSRKIKKYSHTNQLNYLYNCVTGCTIMAKKEGIKQLLPLPTKSKYVAHDHWIGIITSLQGKLTYMPEKYIQYRQHANNEIGTNKISHQFTKLEEVRNLFIEVKLGIFGTYVENASKFPEKLQKKNQKAYQYFKNIAPKKNLNLKGWGIFHQLYKTETMLYYIENFLIMNLPGIAKGLFQIRHFLLKKLGKR